MLTNEQLRRNCYHESGHTVAWIINEARILLVVADSTAPLTESQQRLVTEYCTAQDTVTEQSKGTGYTVVNPGFFKRECIHAVGALNSECLSCVDLIANRAACLFAGGYGTGLLSKSASTIAASLNMAQQRIVETRDDFKKIDCLLSDFTADEQQRKDIREKAEVRAADWINRESKAVSVLAEVLLMNRVLDGVEAENIVKANLNL